MTRLNFIGLSLIGLAGWMWAQPSPGSLYASNGRLAAPTRDLKAANVGDIVTILVNDTASAVATGATNTARKTSAKSSVALLGSSNPRLTNLLTSSGDQQLTSQGTTSRNMALTTTISARVTAVTPDGSLAVEGVKNVGVKVPVVVRLEGTNAEKARGMLAASGLTIAAARDLTDAARTAVALARKGRA